MQKKGGPKYINCAYKSGPKTSVWGSNKGDLDDWLLDDYGMDTVPAVS